MSNQQNVLWVIQQSMIEMGLNKPVEAVTSKDVTVQQMIALLNRAGSDMVIGYPWQQLTKEYVFTTVVGQTEYPLPSDWSYFLDQTEWDRTNHWPLLGPKTAQEWQWLKGGLLSSGPRIRYRVVNNLFEIFPKDPNNTGSSTGPGTSQLAMEYVSANWLKDAQIANTTYPMIMNDTDIVMFEGPLFRRAARRCCRSARNSSDGRTAPPKTIASGTPPDALSPISGGNTRI